MYISFINPFKAELKLCVFEISWYKRKNECRSIRRGFTIVIFNLFISHSWVRFLKTSAPNWFRYGRCLDKKSCDTRATWIDKEGWFHWTLSWNRRWKYWWNIYLLCFKWITIIMKIKDLYSSLHVLRKVKSAIIVTDDLRVIPIGKTAYSDETMCKMNEHIMNFRL